MRPGEVLDVAVLVSRAAYRAELVAWMRGDGVPEARRVTARRPVEEVLT